MFFVCIVKRECCCCCLWSIFEQSFPLGFNFSNEKSIWQLTWTNFVASIFMGISRRSGMWNLNHKLNCYYVINSRLCKLRTHYWNSNRISQLIYRRNFKKNYIILRLNFEGFFFLFIIKVGEINFFVNKIFFSPYFSPNVYSINWLNLKWHCKL